MIRQTVMSTEILTPCSTKVGIGMVGIPIGTVEVKSIPVSMNFCAMSLIACF